MNDNIILMFLDLEGTILGEETGDFKDEEMNNFLKEIERLQKSSNCKAQIHLISPIQLEHMQKIVERIDNLIFDYSVRNNTDIKEIADATAYFDDSKENTNNKITKFPSEIGTTDLNLSGQYGKKKYVKNWVNEMIKRKQVKLYVYAGNGRNDTEAMEYIKSLKNGIVICPKNSRTKIKNDLANFVGTKTELPGTTEALAQMNTYLEKHIENQSAIDRDER